MGETKERQRISFLLTEATRHSKYLSGIFLGYADKNQNPEQYRQAIRANNIFLNTIARIAVVDLHHVLLDSQRSQGSLKESNDLTAIPTVRESILALPGILTEDPTMPLFYAVEATPLSEDKGTYNFLTHKDQEEAAIKFIDKTLHEWCKETVEYRTHGEKFPRGAQRRTPRQFNQQALTAAVETTLKSMPTDDRLRAKAIATPTRMKYQRRTLNIWKDPAAFATTTNAPIPASPWMGNKNWQTVGKNKKATNNPNSQQPKTTKNSTPTDATTPAPEPNKHILTMQQEIKELKNLLLTTTNDTGKSEETLDKMRQQITAEVRASFPETTSNTFATQLHHQVEKAVITRTKTL
jgi:hypothetical protein